jgi:phosphoribosyl 1,2-cyclic phosphodiesterase
MLRFRNLGSGSTGNATVIEARSGLFSSRVLVDCGLGIRVLEQRLAAAGLGYADLDAIFITHEHSDHVGCAFSVARRHGIALWMSEGTYEGIGRPEAYGLLHVARDGQAIDLHALRIVPFAVPHDAHEPLQITCTDGDVRLGVLTDLGHADAHVMAHLRGCQAMLLECNHDPQMLANSPYPLFLRRRVGGLHGHLANAAAGAIATELARHGLRQVVAAHLSLQNNTPELARAALAEALNCDAADASVIDVAHATDGAGWRTV